MSNKLTKEIFVERSKKIHGDKYDYSKVEYINSQTKVCIICPIHGEFWQTPNGHLNGYGCKKCSHVNISLKKTSCTEEFVKKAIKVHGGKYDYSKVEYVNNHTKVCIICPIHGEFWQRPNDHLNGQGCKKCGDRNKKEKQLLTTEEFVKKAIKVHGDKYDYSKVQYMGSHEKIHIVCPIHGEFLQTPVAHLKGYGCPKCALKNRGEKRKLGKDEFIKKAKEIHGNFYNYSKVEYVDSRTKVCIICPIHGEFWQTPHHHLRGQGCFECSKIKNSNESQLFRLLEDKYKNLNVIRQYYNTEILGRKSIDIFIKKINVGIEYQGEQHFKPIKMFGGYKGFLNLVERDQEKYNQCKKNNITLLYFTFDKKTIPENYIDKVYYTFDSLCNKINEKI